MDAADEVRAHLSALSQAVWELAAVVIALRPAVSVRPDQRRAAEQVLVEVGLLVPSEGGPTLAPGVAELARGDNAELAAQASTAILQAAGLLSGHDAWRDQTEAAIMAQGRASARAATLFQAHLLPMLDGLADLLESGAPVMLDIGVGVAASAVEFCREFPRLQVVGLDVSERALGLARGVLDDAGMGERIQLRRQDVATLDDREVFSLAWLPAPFVPRPAIETALPRVVSSLVPGGWLLVGHGRFDGSAVTAARARFQTVAFGGTPLDGQEARQLLGGAGLAAVATLPMPEGAPAITVGRRPTRSQRGETS